MIATKQHNHTQCEIRLKSRILELASEDAVKLKENELRVMNVLMGSHVAMGAYELADQASDKAKRLQPNQVYRAIDKLMGMGLVHQVKSQGGYVACHAEGGCNTPMFLICTSCHQVSETENTNVDSAIKRSVKPTGFVLQNQNVELSGLCSDCS